MVSLEHFKFNVKMLYYHHRHRLGKEQFFHLRRERLGMLCAASTLVYVKASDNKLVPCK
jgi:hypothetical protein